MHAGHEKTVLGVVLMSLGCWVGTAHWSSFGHCGVLVVVSGEVGWSWGVSMLLGYWAGSAHRELLECVGVGVEGVVSCALERWTSTGRLAVSGVGVGLWDAVAVVVVVALAVVVEVAVVVVVVVVMVVVVALVVVVRDGGDGAKWW